MKICTWCESPGAEYDFGKKLWCGWCKQGSEAYFKMWTSKELLAGLYKMEKPTKHQVERELMWRGATKACDHMWVYFTGEHGDGEECIRCHEVRDAKRA